jgi:hypothetical protein
MGAGHVPVKEAGAVDPVDSSFAAQCCPEVQEMISMHKG